MIYFSTQIWPLPDADDLCVMSSMYNIIPQVKVSTIMVKPELYTLHNFRNLLYIHSDHCG